MTALDLFFGPLAALFFLGLVAFSRNRQSDPYLRSVMFPAFGAKLVGALFLGLVYSFYYTGLYDTTFYQSGAVLIHRVFWQRPDWALELIFDSEGTAWNIFRASIPYEDDMKTYMVIRIAGFIGLFCNANYTAIAFAFAFWSFVGSWKLYQVFYTEYPRFKRVLAIAVFYVPSTVVWGSGLFKDCLSYGALGMFVFGVYQLLIRRRFSFSALGYLLLGGWMLASVKIYILLCFIPATGYWVYLRFAEQIRSPLLRGVIAPVLLASFGYLGFLTIQTLALGTEYEFDKIGAEIKETYEDIYRSGKARGGSIYDLGGKLDGTFNGLLPFAPRAIGIALYRPFIWEVRNPLEALAGLENLYFLVLSLLVLFQQKLGVLLSRLRQEHLVQVGLVFTLSFAFFAGLSSGTFGTLVRYKIPFLPFFVMALQILRAPVATQRERKVIEKKRRRQRQYSGALGQVSLGLSQLEELEEKKQKENSNPST